MSKDSIYTVDDNGNAAVRITTQTATATDPSSIYGVDENGNAAMRVIGIGGGGGGTSDYNQLTNRPKINGVLLSGDKSTSDLGIHASKQITVNGTVTAGGYSVPNPTAEEMTAIYNAVVAGDSVQIVDKNNVYYQVILADSMDGAINVEILYFSEMAIIYSLEHNVVTVETKKIGGESMNVSNITDLSTFTINTNTIYNGAELTEFGINLPTTVDNKFIAEIHFTSGEEPTAFNWEDDILFDGVDCVENLFIPESNKRYSVMFFYNGESVLGIVYGI